MPEKKNRRYDTLVVRLEAWWNLQELSKKVILDLGCVSNVMGVLRDGNNKNNDGFMFWRKDEVFRFGDGKALKSK